VLILCKFWIYYICQILHSRHVLNSRMPNDASSVYHIIFWQWFDIWSFINTYQDFCHYHCVQILATIRKQSDFVVGWKHSYFTSYMFCIYNASSYKISYNVYILMVRYVLPRNPNRRKYMHGSQVDVSHSTEGYFFKNIILLEFKLIE
jgi:hypothetical protein